MISPGTERAVTALAQSSLLAKARARPDLVRQVVRKARTEGFAATRQAVRSRLAEDLPLGYSAAGMVLEVGAAVTGVRPGQLVATGGAGKANHAEFQAVPGLLCATVPDGVPAAGRGVHHDRRHRAARAAARRGGPGLEGRGARARPDRAAGRPAGDRGRLRRGRASTRPSTRGATAAGSGVLALDERGDATTDQVLSLVPGPGRGRRAGLRGGPVLGRGDAGARALPGPGRGGDRGRRRAAAGPHPVLRAGAVAAVRPLVRPRALRTLVRGVGRGLPGRPGAVDRGAQLRGGPRPAGQRPAPGRGPGHAQLRHRRGGRRLPADRAATPSPTWPSG